MATYTHKKKLQRRIRKGRKAKLLFDAEKQKSEQKKNSKRPA